MDENSLRRTALHGVHVEIEGKMVPFGGWHMPLHYGSQLAEHNTVREKVGMFDVSHMSVVDIIGADSEAFLRRLLANDVRKLGRIGQALYTVMLNEQAGIIDDLIVYKTGDGFRLVVNCATTQSDLDWMMGTKAREQFTDLDIVHREELSIVAVQGPQALDVVGKLMDSSNVALLGELGRFTAFSYKNWFVARTGYTGEDGVEIILPHDEALTLWQSLSEAGVAPCGLGARDTLRLEAGLNLYGTDMTIENTPLESNLGWTIAWSDERDFIGKEPLAFQKSGGDHKILTGLVLEGRGVIRNSTPVFHEDKQVGTVTSGGFGPTLQRSVALARIDSEFQTGLEVEIRRKRIAVRRVAPPFIKAGHATF